MNGIGLGLIVGGILLATYLLTPKGSLWFMRGDLSQSQIIDKFKNQVELGGINSYLATNLEDWDWRAILAICAWETGWLCSPDAKNRVNHKCNILGIDIYGKPGQGRTFGSYYDCLAYFERLVRTTPRYTVAYIQRWDGESFIRALSKGGYNSNQSWIDGVLWCYHKLA